MAGLNEFGDVRREIPGEKKIEAAAHGRERLREIVNNAVQQNFLLLSFANQALVGEQGIAGGLKKLLLLGKRAGKIANQQDLLACQPERGGLKGNFLAGGVSLDPTAGARGTRCPRLPEFLGVGKEVFEEGRFFSQTKRLVAPRLPQRVEPIRKRGQRLEHAAAAEFKQRRA